MSWNINYLPEALEDLHRLDGSQRILIRKAIQIVGNKNNTNLSGFLKVKLRGAGLRIVYQLIRRDEDMLVIIIGACEDDEFYEIASKRITKHDL